MSVIAVPVEDLRLAAGIEPGSPGPRTLSRPKIISRILTLGLIGWQALLNYQRDKVSCISVIL